MKRTVFVNAKIDWLLSIDYDWSKIELIHYSSLTLSSVQELMLPWPNHQAKRQEISCVYIYNWLIIYIIVFLWRRMIILKIHCRKYIQIKILWYIFSFVPATDTEQHKACGFKFKLVFERMVSNVFKYTFAVYETKLEIVNSRELAAFPLG